MEPEESDSIENNSNNSNNSNNEGEVIDINEGNESQTLADVSEEEAVRINTKEEFEFISNLIKQEGKTGKTFWVGAI